MRAAVLQDLQKFATRKAKNTAEKPEEIISGELVLGDRGKPPPAARKGGEPTDANAGFNASQEDMRRAFREKLQRRRHSGDNKVPEDKPQDGRRRSSGDLPVTSAAGGRRGSGVSTASTHAQAVQPLEVRLGDDSSDDEWDDDPGR